MSKNRYHLLGCCLFVVSVCIWLPVGCTGERPAPDVATTPEIYPAEPAIPAHICGASIERVEYCPTDFVRLAVSPKAADRKHLGIVGFLAVDRGHVVLFADEEAYEHLQFGRSIRVQGKLSELSALVSEFGYKNVRLWGEFRANSYKDPKDDRLGELVPPIRARLARSPIAERLGPDDIVIPPEYFEDGQTAENGQVQ